MLRSDVRMTFAQTQLKRIKNNKKRQRRMSSQFVSKNESMTMKHKKNVEKRQTRCQRSNSVEANRNEKKTSTASVATILFKKRNHLRREHERAFKKSLNDETKSSINWSSRRALNNGLNTIAQNIQILTFNNDKSSKQSFKSLCTRSNMSVTSKISTADSENYHHL